MHAETLFYFIIIDVNFKLESQEVQVVANLIKAQLHSKQIHLKK